MLTQRFGNNAVWQYFEITQLLMYATSDLAYFCKSLRRPQLNFIVWDFHFGFREAIEEHAFTDRSASQRVDTLFPLRRP